MPSDFQPLTLSVEREQELRRTYDHPRLKESSTCAWCQCLLYPPDRVEPHTVDCIAENIRQLLAECEAQARAAASLRQQLEDANRTSELERSFNANAIERLTLERDDALSQLEQAQKDTEIWKTESKRVERASQKIGQECARLQQERDAARESRRIDREGFEHAYNTQDILVKQAQERASQAEAALAELQKLIDKLKRGDNCWCEVGIGNPMMRGEHSAVCWELQRRRSRPAEDK